MKSHLHGTSPIVVKILTDNMFVDFFVFSYVFGRREELEHLAELPWKVTQYAIMLRHDYEIYQ